MYVCTVNIYTLNAKGISYVTNTNLLLCGDSSEGRDIGNHAGFIATGLTVVPGHRFLYGGSRVYTLYSSSSRACSSNKGSDCCRINKSSSSCTNSTYIYI